MPKAVFRTYTIEETCGKYCRERREEAGINAMLYQRLGNDRRGKPAHNDETMEALTVPGSVKISRFTKP